MHDFLFKIHVKIYEIYSIYKDPVRTISFFKNQRCKHNKAISFNNVLLLSSRKVH